MATANDSKSHVAGNEQRVPRPQPAAPTIEAQNCVEGNLPVASKCAALDGKASDCAATNREMVDAQSANSETSFAHT